MRHNDLMKTNVIISVLYLIFSTQVFASAADEINHLLNFVKTSSCKFERNGSIHQAAEAVEHIRKKYTYYEDDIENTEDFIRYSATKSAVSGRHYNIHCEGKKIVTSREWLLGELERYRNSRS